MKSLISKKQTAGFTLVETLIAIAILGVAVGAAFGIAQKSLGSSAFTRNQTSAYFLAAEGLELVHNIRDQVVVYNKSRGSNALVVDWLAPIKTACGVALDTPLSTTLLSNDSSSSNFCNFDVNPLGNLTIAASGAFNQQATDIRTDCQSEQNYHACRMILKTVGTNKYYSSVPTVGTGGSIFYRSITIQESQDASGKKEALVTSSVSWLGNTFTVSEILANWRPAN
jgi:prepilin-type N-terminal cleavage/methylation domain-containing protein